MPETVILQLTLELPDMAELFATANAEHDDVSNIVSRIVAGKIAADRTQVFNQNIISENPPLNLQVEGDPFSSNRPFGGTPARDDAPFDADPALQAPLSQQAAMARAKELSRSATAAAAANLAGAAIDVAHENTLINEAAALCLGHEVDHNR